MASNFIRAAEAASKTLEAARTVIGSFDEISLGQRQRSELTQFLEAFCTELERRRTLLSASVSDLDLQLLTARQLELEEAIRFLDRSFIEPRKQGSNIQILEAADWMCVESYQLFVGEDNTNPVGPIVAIDASESPAVWTSNANLPIPTLFKTQPKHFERDEKLGEFPLICLPQHFARTPEYLPLLSHEVGHAIDNVIGLSVEVCSQLEGASHTKYWDAWMREIVADSVGIALSGEAFGIALHNFLNLQPPFDELALDHSYPPFELRLKFITVQLNLLSKNGDKDDWKLDPSVLASSSDKAVELLEQFQENVVGKLDQLVFQPLKSWHEDSQSVLKLSKDLKDEDSEASISDGFPFRLLPSAVCMAKFTEDLSNKFDSRESFRMLHGAASGRTDKPGWVKGETNWVFNEEYLPALRPTLLCNSQKFKVPPALLLNSHRKIAFVGATNWQLDKKNLLGDAFKLRNRNPWDEIHLFFGSKELLENVEYGERELRKLADREEAITKLHTKLETNGWAKRWRMYQFDGPPLFASYWDWDVRGGRIHFSPALLGTAIGKCPGSDFVWSGPKPTNTYSKYVVHLQHLMKSAKSIASNY